MRISRDDFENLRSTLTHFVGEATFLFKNHSEWRGRWGGYFCLADGVKGEPLFAPTQIREVPMDKVGKYRELCQEKAVRLAANPLHLSSYETRDPNMSRWGGAVRLDDDLIFSFSGFPEAGDEALMLLLGESHYKASGRALENTRLIVAYSQNPYWERLHSFLGRLVD